MVACVLWTTSAVFVSCPVYRSVRVITSVVRSDHKAVVAYPNNRTVLVWMYLLVLHIAKSHRISMRGFCSKSLKTSLHTACPWRLWLLLQGGARIARSILSWKNDNCPLPRRRVAYVTPFIKAQLRRKNRLMRAGRVEEASAIAVRIGKFLSNATELACRRKWWPSRC